jgi:putative NADH-flavin reductase
MKIALFGATGMVGSAILAEALARGHQELEFTAGVEQRGEHDQRHRLGAQDTRSE